MRPFMVLADRMGALVVAARRRPDPVDRHPPLRAAGQRQRQPARQRGGGRRAPADALVDGDSRQRSRASRKDAGSRSSNRRARGRATSRTCSPSSCTTQRGERWIEGTVFEPGSARLSMLDGVDVEAPLEGVVLVIHNNDQPGVIGDVGIDPRPPRRQHRQLRARPECHGRGRRGGARFGCGRAGPARGRAGDPRAAGDHCRAARDHHAENLIAGTGVSAGPAAGWRPSPDRSAPPHRRRWLPPGSARRASPPPSPSGDRRCPPLIIAVRTSAPPTSCPAIPSSRSAALPARGSGRGTSAGAHRRCRRFDACACCGTSNSKGLREGLARRGRDRQPRCAASTPAPPRRRRAPACLPVSRGAPAVAAERTGPRHPPSTRREPTRGRRTPSRAEESWERVGIVAQRVAACRCAAGGALSGQPCGHSSTTPRVPGGKISCGKICRAPCFTLRAARHSSPRIAVAIIPARYHSTRLPGKALADIAGRPMIEHVYRRAAAARSIASVIVATDDRRIVDAVAAFGGEARDDVARRIRAARTASRKWPRRSTATSSSTCRGTSRCSRRR